MLISVFPTLDAAAVTNDLSTLRQCVPFAGVERRRAIRRAAPAWCAPRRAAPAARRGGPVADLILNCANLTAILERHIFYAFVHKLSQSPLILERLFRKYRVFFFDVTLRKILDRKRVV